MPDFRTSDDLTLVYDDEGTGPALLCLAGLTRSAEDFQFVLPHLTGFRVIRLDYRGRGRSDFAVDYSTYSIAREAQDAVELLDHLGVDRAYILGTSRGGLIAMALAEAHIDRLSGVVLNDVGPHVDEEGLSRIADYLGFEPAFPDLDTAALALQAGLAAQFPDVPLARWHAHATALWEERPEGGLKNRYDRRLRDAFVDQVASGETQDLWSGFDALSAVPVGVIRGAHSDILSQETLEEMARRNPALIHATVPDRGHVPFLDEPEALDVLHKTFGAPA